LRALLAKYEEIELLLKIGEYSEGADPLADEAVARNPALDRFLRQSIDEFSSFEESVQALHSAVGHG